MGQEGERPAKILFSSFVKRYAALRRVGFNLFSLPSDAIDLDLLTDSGTSTLSEAQLCVREAADQSYDGSSTSKRLHEKLERIFGFPLAVFTPQGRGAEFIFNTVMITAGKRYVAGNTPFDTTRHNIEARGGIIADCSQQGSGNVDTYPLENKPDFKEYPR